MDTPPQLLDSLALLTEWFRENSDTGKNAYEKGMGVQAMEFDGQFVRDMELHRVATFWRRIAKALPSDACFVTWMDSQFVLQSVSSAGYTDQYLILIGSKEYPQLPEGETIPRLRVTIDRTDGSVEIQQDSPHNTAPTTQIP